MSNLPTVSDVRNDPSGTRGKHQLHKLGYQRCPIVKFGQREYLFTHYQFPRPGRNTAEVIDVTEFDRDSHFCIFRTTLDPECQAYGYLISEDEGQAVLTVYDKKPDELHDYVNPISAVLSYRIEPPTRDDLEHVADELDEQLQENGLATWLSRM
jgi:hypothetical protein